MSAAGAAVDEARASWSSRTVIEGRTARAALVLLGAGWLSACAGTAPAPVLSARPPDPGRDEPARPHATPAVYACPLHPEETQPFPGACCVCGTTLRMIEKPAR